MEEQQLVKLNFNTKANPQEIKVNSLLTKEKTKKLQMLFKIFKDVFSWTYKDLKGIPPTLVQHIIELNTSIPPAHQARYN
jgi:predicted transcriptional regulator